jgi:hypothetical protein
MFVDCGSGPTTNGHLQQPENLTNTIAPTTKMQRSEILLKISFDGGLVRDGNDISGGRIGHSDFVVTRDGAYSLSGDVTRKKSGSVPKSELDELAELIEAADFDALKSKKFTGECPAAYDGAEVTYGFYTRKGVEVLASCKVAIDVESPLFAKALEIYHASIK